MGNSTSSSSVSSLSHIGRYPLIYHPDYNISWYGIEKLHPFDSGKYGKIYNFLIEKKLILNKDKQVYKPTEVSQETLLQVHSAEYLNKTLKSSLSIASMVEVPPLAVLPNSLLHSRVLLPMKLATAGSLLAAELAVRQKLKQNLNISTGESRLLKESKELNNEIDEKSIIVGNNDNHKCWAINLSGGYHHASGSKGGGGFCIYADISLSILNIHANHPEFTKFLILDTDAHTGNGYANDKLAGVFKGLDVFIMDMYNDSIYPMDIPARKAINKEVKLNSHTKDEEYLKLLRKHFRASLTEFKADLVIYNAGTDCLLSDPLGRLDITAEGIAERDLIVFEMCFEFKVPIVMLLSGGYQKSNAKVIADSIENLNTKHNIFNQFRENNAANSDPNKNTQPSNTTSNTDNINNVNNPASRL